MLWTRGGTELLEAAPVFAAQAKAQEGGRWVQRCRAWWHWTGVSSSYSLHIENTGRAVARMGHSPESGDYRRKSVGTTGSPRKASTRKSFHFSLSKD